MVRSIAPGHDKTLIGMGLNLRRWSMPLEWWAGLLGGLGLALIVWWLADRARR